MLKIFWLLSITNGPQVDLFEGQKAIHIYIYIIALVLCNYMTETGFIYSWTNGCILKETELYY